MCTALNAMAAMVEARARYLIVGTVPTVAMRRVHDTMFNCMLGLKLMCVAEPLEHWSEIL